MTRKVVTNRKTVTCQGNYYRQDWQGYSDLQEILIRLWNLEYQHHQQIPVNGNKYINNKLFND